MTDTDDIRIRETWGCVLALAADKAGMEHRWWFRETDGGRLVLISEVVEYDEDAHPSLTAGRHYVPEAEADVPPRILDALDDDGYPHPRDTDGRKV